MRSTALVAASVAAAALPLVGLASLLLRKQLDPHFENYRAHFVVFGLVGALAFALGSGRAPGERGPCGRIGLRRCASRPCAARDAPAKAAPRRRGRRDDELVRVDVAKVPPLHNPNSEAATGSLLAVLAIVGTLVYGVSAAR